MSSLLPTDVHKGYNSKKASQIKFIQNKSKDTPEHNVYIKEGYDCKNDFREEYKSHKIDLTIKNFKSERVKYQENEKAKRYQSPSEERELKKNSRTSLDGGAVRMNEYQKQDLKLGEQKAYQINNSSAKKLLEIESQLKSCRNRENYGSHQSSYLLVKKQVLSRQVSEEECRREQQQQQQYQQYQQSQQKQYKVYQTVNKKQDSLMENKENEKQILQERHESSRNHQKNRNSLDLKSNNNMNNCSNVSILRERIVPQFQSNAQTIESGIYYSQNHPLSQLSNKKEQNLPHFQVLPSYYSDHQKVQTDQNTPDKLKYKQKSIHCPILDKRRKSQGSLTKAQLEYQQDNQSNHNSCNGNSIHHNSTNNSNLNNGKYSSKYISEKQVKKDNQQNTQVSPQVSSVFIKNGYTNIIEDKKSTASKSLNGITNIRQQTQNQEVVRAQRQHSQSISQQKLPSTSASELRLKRIRQRNASKSELIQLVNKVDDKQVDFHLNLQPEASILDENNGKLKEVAKKRIQDLIIQQSKQNEINYSVAQEPGGTAEQEEIKGYIQGLMGALKKISDAKKPKKEESQDNKVIQGAQQQLKGDKKKEYNPQNYGFPQAVSQEILQSVIVQKQQPTFLKLNDISKEKPRNKQFYYDASPDNSSFTQNKKSLLKIEYPHSQQSAKKVKVSLDLQKEKLVHQEERQIGWFRSVEQPEQQGAEMIKESINYSDIRRNRSTTSNNKMNVIIFEKKEQREESEEKISNSKREHLIKLKRGRSTIKALNPYKSVDRIAKSSEDTNRVTLIPNGKEQKQTINHYFQRKRALTANSQSSLLQRNDSYQIASNASATKYNQNKNEQENQKRNREEEKKGLFHNSSQKDRNQQRVENTTRKKVTLSIDGTPSKKCSFIDDAETIKTEGGQITECMIFADENQNEVSGISLSNVNQLAHSKIPNSFLNSDLLNDFNLKKGGDRSNSSFIKLNLSSNESYAKQKVERDSNSLNYNKKEIKGTSSNQIQQFVQPVPIANDSNYQRQTIESNAVSPMINSQITNSRKPPTHRNVLKKQNQDRNIQPQQYIQINKINNMQPNLSRNNSSNKIAHNYCNISQTSCTKGNTLESEEKILDLLLLNTNELKHKFKDNPQNQYKYTFDASSLPALPQLSAKINIFQQLTQKMFNIDSNI